MSMVGPTFVLSGCREGLTGATARPYISFAPSGKVESEIPTCDACEPVDAIEPSDIIGRDVDDAFVTNHSRRDVPRIHQRLEPRACERIDFVVERPDAHKP
jgi:hypothetical protein